jgi:hypothetical protein
MAHIINASTFMIGAGDRVEQATPLIKIDSVGKITAEAVQAEGYVKGGTKTATKQLDTAEGGHITPSKEEQTPAHAGEFLKGDLVVLPIPSEYIIPKGTKTITDNGEYNVRESEKVLVAVNKGVDAPDVPQAVPSITVSDNGLITATAVQEGGLVPSGTKTATKQLTTQEGKTIIPTESEQTAVEDNRYTTGAVKIAPIPSEYIVPSGTVEITENGEHDVSEFEKAVINVEGSFDDLVVNIYDPTASPIEQGTINSSTLADGSSSTRLRTSGFIPTKPKTVYRVSTNLDMLFLIECTDAKTAIRNSGWKTSPYSFETHENCKFIRITFSNAANSAITVADFEYLKIEPLVSSGVGYELQEVEIIPTEKEQIATPDIDHYGISKAVVKPIPSEYLVGDEIAAQENLITDIEELVAKVGGGTSEPNTDLEDALITHKFEEETYSNDRITSVGYGAFYGASKIKTLDLPNVTIIEGYALYKCTSLTSLNAPLLKSVGSYAVYNVALPVIDFPELETMTTYSFSEITAPCVVRLPKAKTAGNSSFRNSRGITIADFTACTKVDNLAFYYCNGLRALILRKSDAICTLQNTNALTNTQIANGTGYIYVPRVLYDAYRASTNWSSFADQFKILENYTVDGTITGEFYEG